MKLELILLVLAIAVGSIQGTPVKSIRLNKHLDAVAGTSVQNMLRQINMADDVEEEVSPSCIQIKIQNIQNINTENEKEVDECIVTEKKNLEQNDEAARAGRRALDAVIKKVIANLTECVDIKDDFKSTECSAKLDSNNNALTDNSGLAIKFIENVKIELASIQAEKKYCVDQSVRKAQKGIAKEQAELQLCFNPPK